MKHRIWIYVLGLALILSACGQVRQVVPEFSTFEASPTSSEISLSKTSTLPEPQISLQRTEQLLPTETSATTTTFPSTSESTSSVVPLSIIENKAVLASETIPDGTLMKKNQAFTKTWILKNTGTETWTANYYLELLAEKSDNVFNAPSKINFGRSVQPGDAIELSIDLTAPQTDGEYTLMYRVLDGTGQELPIGMGNRIWLTISIGTKAAVQSPTSLDPSGVTFSVGDITHNGGITTIQIHSSFSMIEYSVQPVPILVVDGKQIPFAGGIDDWQASGKYSYLWQYSISEQSFNDAKSVTMVFDTSIRKNLWGDQIVEACRSALNRLQATYPEISFGCNPAMGGYPYDSLRVPSGLTRAQAHQIVMDAIESASYGRWEVKIR